MRHPRAAQGLTVVLVAALLPAAFVPSAAAAELPVDYSYQSVLPFDGAAYDWFGDAVAVWGDTALIGAPGDDDLGAISGSAYVYMRIDDYWVQRQKLTAGDGSDGDYFGSPVAIRGETAVIGAPGAGSNTGAAYVFTRTGGVWSQYAKLTADDGEVADLFGRAVAIDGETVLVGAPGDDDRGSGAGAVYVFTPTDTTWTQRAKITATDGDAAAAFGMAVALDDGTALVGASEDETARGSAYVFTGSGSTWTQRAKLVAPDRDTYDYFGFSLALERGTALVGAYGEDDQRGAAHVFTGSGATWAHRTRLVASTRDTFDRFGLSVALSGGAILAGARGYGDTGAAYVFTGGGAAWEERTRFGAPGTELDDEYGDAVALSGGNAVVGAHFNDVGASNQAGAAHFHTFTTQLTLDAKRLAGADRYLTAVAVSKQGFPAGAPAVVIATGANWPDALGGSALAGAAHGPLLLTRQAALPAEVSAEVRRLGAVKAYVLGGTDVVSGSVEDELVGLLGRANVERLAGPTRYETASAVADEVIELLGCSYDGRVFVATGLNYPDATAASPIAAWQPMPIMLADVRAGTVDLPAFTEHAVVLGSEAAVPQSVYEYLEDELSADHVSRIGGANRYETAAMIAERAVDEHGMKWNASGLATGENFPDALAAGPMLAIRESVLLLTRSSALSAEARLPLEANHASIWSMFVFGGELAVSPAVLAEAELAAGL
ncbi:MAG: cell wall-binding repeat-containing protein [Coriobacteriia bacterium]|nr:cell wall-binding repeat-containing protein [Coriobacteriia bacterium]MBN2848747.1 cell wall-binding repeat-containing protein [Coriobacteriia bacterium]